jgi:hypothetical protein
MSLSCPERIAAAIPGEVRASRIARARTFAAVHESGSGPTRKSRPPPGTAAYRGPAATKGNMLPCDYRVVRFRAASDPKYDRRGNPVADSGVGDGFRTAARRAGKGGPMPRGSVLSFIESLCGARRAEKHAIP